MKKYHLEKGLRFFKFAKYVTTILKFVHPENKYIFTKINTSYRGFISELATTRYILIIF